MPKSPSVAKAFLASGTLDAVAVGHIEMSQTAGESFLDALIRDERLTDLQVAEVLSRHYHIPLLSAPAIFAEQRALTYVTPEMAHKHTCVPVRLEGDALVLAQHDPLDFQPREWIEARHGIRVQVVLAPRSAIRAAIAQQFDVSESLQRYIKDIPEQNIQFVDLDLGTKECDTLDVAKSESQPVIKIVNRLLHDGLNARASDIHIEPMAHFVKVRFRIDGVLNEILTLPKWLQNAVVSRIKILAELDIAERRKPQDGRINVRFDDLNADIRVSTLPTHYGQKVVLRLLRGDKQGLGLEQLGFAPEDLARLRECIRRPQGMILTTGPTGSGKSSTLYACLEAIKSPHVNIITIENPIEYEIPGVNQVQTNERAGLTFAAALRSVLRQDPNVIMVGEIRDQETAEIAFQAAMTGHLVLSTLHTNDSASTLARLADLGVDPFLTGSSLLLVLAQRLLRSVCPDCRETYAPAPAALAVVGLQDHPGPFVRGKGCRACKDTGYLGRQGIYEMLSIDPRLRDLIARNAPESELRKAAQASGMVPMVERAADEVKAGHTTAEEVARVIQSVLSAGRLACPGCRRDIEADFTSCPYCGHSRVHVCTQCGDPLKADWKVCPRCRTPVPEEAAGIPPSASAPGPVTAAAEARVEAAGAADEPPHHILVVAGDAAEGAKLQSVLSGPGRRAEAVASVAAAQRILDATEVSLIVLDLFPPDMDGRVFIQHLRESPLTEATPIVVVTGAVGEHMEGDCVSLGVDAFFVKPYDLDAVARAGERLLHQAPPRLERTHGRTLPGMPGRAAFRKAYKRTVSMTSRTHLPVAFGIIALDGFKAITDQYGEPTAHAVLRRAAASISRSVRDYDIFAHRGGAEFVALFPNTDRAGGLRALDKVLAALRGERFQAESGEVFTVTFSGGVIELPERTPLQEALTEADRFLYRAQASGRNRVLATEEPNGVPTRKIVLSEGDEVTASLVKHRLGREGFEVLHLTDGASALAAALRVRPALVMLGAQTAGLDGFEVLRRLRGTEGFERTPILMLSPMGAEEAVSRSVSLGADDYLLKPFSSGDLLSRVHRLLTQD